MSDFETWWQQEGQEFLFALNTTTDDDIKLVAEVAWKNGACCAEQAEQKPVAFVNLEWWMSGSRAEECFDHHPHDTLTPLYAAPVRTKDLTDAVDAAMVEMQNIHPPLRRSECERLIRAANYAAPVRTKDLTDDEIWSKGSQVRLTGGGIKKGLINYARAVIAADREKNKCQH